MATFFQKKRARKSCLCDFVSKNKLKAAVNMLGLVIPKISNREIGIDTISKLTKMVLSSLKPQPIWFNSQFCGEKQAQVVTAKDQGVTTMLHPGRKTTFGDHCCGHGP